MGLDSFKLAIAQPLPSGFNKKVLTPQVKSDGEVTGFALCATFLSKQAAASSGPFPLSSPSASSMEEF